MKHRLIATALTLLCLFSLCGCGLTKDHRTSQERWSLFPSGAHYNNVQSLNARYLWMQGGLWCGQIQQYDMLERRMTVFTDRDGLPLSTRGVQRLIAADDERCLLVLEHESQPFLWTPDLGWRSLPSLDDQYELKDVAFDTDGGIIVLATDKVRLQQQTTCTIFGLVAGGWHPLGTAPLARASVIIPFDDAYVIKAYDGHSRLYRVDKSFNQPSVVIADTLPDENRLKYFRLTGKTFMATPFPMQHPALPAFPGVRVMQTLREITPDGLVETEMPTTQYLDLQTGTFKPMSLTVLPDQKVSCSIEAVASWETDVTAGAMLFPVRDINGDIWLPDRTFSKGRWVKPAGAVHEVHGTEAAAVDRAYYDSDQHRWRKVIPPGRWEHFRVVDARRKLAWGITDPHAPTMQLIRFDKGTAVVIREVPREEHWGLPVFQDGSGNWWLAGKSLIRLDDDGNVSPVEGKRPSKLWFQRKTGAIFAYEHPDFLRYDAAANQFTKIPAQTVHDAFAVQVGNWELSLLPSQWYDSMPSLMARTETGWEEFPLGRGSTRPARYGDRILFIGRDRDGVWEYDGSSDRWVRLHSGHFHVAFDPDGRRILANHHTILVYDGDPFEDPGYREYERLRKAQEQVLDACVELLESDDERVRGHAMRQIQGLTPLIRPRIETLSADDRLPESTRQLLKSAAADRSSDLLPPSLFDLAHPPAPEIPAEAVRTPGRSPLPAFPLSQE